MRNLKKIRESKGQSQLNLAMKIGVQQETISAYENGKAMPTVDTLLKLCKHYNCSSDFLLDLTDIKFPVNDLLIDNLDLDETGLIQKYRNLSTDNKNKVLGFLEAISQ